MIPQFKRNVFETVLSRLQETRRFLQVMTGPRQTGKTTLALQIIDTIKIPAHYASADEPTLRDRIWIEQQWELARLLTKKNRKVILVLDEIQKIPGWSETVKRLWDEDIIHNEKLKVLILGSSPLLVQRGLVESLAGRFEVIPMSHWSYTEMKTAFGWTLEQFLFFGGYPGSAELINNEPRWKRYILDSLVETTISKDILLMTRVDKPALLRQLFQIGCDYSGQILSYQKMLGQLQDAGNTTTLAHYLQLLSGAGMVTGLQKYSSQKFRRRSSSPKLQVVNNALITTQSAHTFVSAQQDREFWGRIVESAVGAHLLNSTAGTDIKVYYWRQGNQEVDYVVQSGTTLVAIEVKSDHKRYYLPGMNAFDRLFSPQQKLLVGWGGFPLEDFLTRSIQELIL